MYFPCIKCTGMTSSEFCETLLKEEKVAVVPGRCFWKIWRRIYSLFLCLFSRRTKRSIGTH